jgi:hypothetical protein
MEEEALIREVRWEGPYSWPGYEEKNSLESIPAVSGIYLQTFEYWSGYLIYAAGITRRAIPTRFREHTREYMNGNYNVLDIDAAEHGYRREIWHGWGYARDHRDEFEAKRPLIVEAVDKQLERFRIFIAQIEDEPRIHERIEASVMNKLYCQLPPICELPDKNMQLAGRWDSEVPIIIKNNCESKLHGLPEYLGI